MNLLNEGDKKMKDINKILDELEKLYPDAQCETNIISSMHRCKS